MSLSFSLKQNSNLKPNQIDDIISQATNNISTDNSGYIPEPPAIFDESIIKNILGEPTLGSLGLGFEQGWLWPQAWVQEAIELSHVYFGLPWYQSIMLFALVLRSILFFTITIKAQKNATAMRRVSPITNKLKEKLTEARLSGDALKSLDKFYKKINFSIKII